VQWFADDPVLKTAIKLDRGPIQVVPERYLRNQGTYNLKMQVLDIAKETVLFDQEVQFVPLRC
jgi:hypothetical protein